MRFLILLWVLFFIELGSLVAFGEYFGFFALMLEIILSGVIGVLLLFSTFSGSNESIIELLRGARDPREVVISNLSKAIGAILLIIPGIFGDCLGLLLQIGILDSLFLWVITHYGSMKFTANYHSKNSDNHENEIIDVEVIDKDAEDQKMFDDAVRQIKRSIGDRTPD